MKPRQTIFSREVVRRLFPAGIAQFRLKSPSGILDCLDVLPSLGVDRRKFWVTDAGQVEWKVADEGDATSGMPAIDFIGGVARLGMLKACPGFSSLAEGLRNPQQYLATMFEVDCAFLLHATPDVQGLEFSPEYLVGGTLKRPDFRFRWREHTFVCECKSMISLNGLWRSRALKLSGKLGPLVESAIPAERRVEIAFSSLPNSWNGTLPGRVAEVLRKMLRLDELDVTETIDDGPDSVMLRLLRASDPAWFGPGQRVARAAPGTPSRMDTIALDSLYRDTRDVVADALTQLPRDSICLVFVACFMGRGVVDAIAKSFESDNAAHVGAVVTWTDRVAFHPNPRLNPSLVPAQELVRRFVDGREYLPPPGA